MSFADGTLLEVVSGRTKSLALTFLDWPPPGFDAIDAVATLNGTVYAWWNGLLAWSDASKHGWKQLDRQVSTVDAATEFGDPREVLLFVGTQFWRFDLVDMLVVNFGYSPYSLSSGSCDIASIFNPTAATETAATGTATATTTTTTQTPPATSSAFFLDAVSYNSTEKLVYFFKGGLFATCSLDKSTWTFTNATSAARISNAIGAARISDHFGTGFPALWDAVSAAASGPDDDSTFFFHELAAVVSQDGQILSPGIVSSFRSSTCQLCRCSDVSSGAQRCSPDNGVQVGVPECVVPPELAPICVATNGVRPYVHAGQYFAQCLQCECASPCTGGTCTPREPFCYDANNMYVAQNQSAACVECEQLCAPDSCSRTRTEPLDGVAVRIVFIQVFQGDPSPVAFSKRAPHS